MILSLAYTCIRWSDLSTTMLVARVVVAADAQWLALQIASNRTAFTGISGRLMELLFSWGRAFRAFDQAGMANSPAHAFSRRSGSLGPLFHRLRGHLVKLEKLAAAARLALEHEFIKQHLL